MVLHRYADWRIGATSSEKHCYKPTDSVLLTFDDYGSVAQVTEIPAKEIARLVRLVPRLMELGKKRLWMDYDEEAAVLYLSFRRPQKATESDMRDDGILVHYRGKEVVGLTFLDASTR